MNENETVMCAMKAKASSKEAKMMMAWDSDGWNQKPRMSAADKAWIRDQMEQEKIDRQMQDQTMQAMMNKMAEIYGEKAAYEDRIEELQQQQDLLSSKSVS